MITVLFKSIEEIKKLTAVATPIDDSVLHTDGVKFVEEYVVQAAGGELVDIRWYRGDNYALGVKREGGVTSYFHPSWFKVIRDSTTHNNIILPTTYTKDLRFIKSKKYAIDTKEIKVVRIVDLVLCECGKELDVDGETECSACLIDKNYIIHNYSHKPDPIFVGGQLKGDREHPLWYGIELEYSVNDRLPLAVLVRDNKAYLKRDNSITNGTEGSAEYVTHPHSFKALMAKDSWVNKLGILDVVDNPDKNGCHIHVSKTAWTDDKHYALTYHLMYELGKRGILEEIGGRTFTHYCRLNKDTVTHISKITKSKKNDLAREMWLNERNENTIEFRFFASSNNSDTVKRYIQLLDSIIKYTRYHKKTVSTKGWLTYVSKYNNKYNELTLFLKDTAIPIISVSYKLPIYKKYKIDNLKAIHVTKIYSILTVDGTTFFPREGKGINISQQYITFYDKNEFYKELPISTIKEVVIGV